MSPQAEIAAKLRAQIKKDLPGVKARVRLRYDLGLASIVVQVDREDCVDEVSALATIYWDDLLSVSVNGRWIYPDDENDHSHMFDN